MKSIAILLPVAFLSLMLLVSGPTQSQKLKGKFHRKADKIENNYIVVLDDSVVGERGEFSIAPYIAFELASRHAGKIKREAAPPLK